ncbi:hypothetical protein QG37_04242 [Candidozyma auris]|nr:hypothetical protein QG37_04242 [[Candida] auris]
MKFDEVGWELTTSSFFQGKPVYGWGFVPNYRRRTYSDSDFPPLAPQNTFWLKLDSSWNVKTEEARTSFLIEQNA